MADEHKHKFLWERDRQFCWECWKSKQEIELEQQLAQAREEIETLKRQLDAEYQETLSLHAVIDDLEDYKKVRYQDLQEEKAKLAEARALLESVLPARLPAAPDVLICSVCGVSTARSEEIEHDDKCPIPDISAFLAKYPTT